MANGGEIMETVKMLFSWSPKSLWTALTVVLKLFASWKKSYNDLDNILKVEHLASLLRVRIVGFIFSPVIICFGPYGRLVQRIGAFNL